MSHLTSSAEPGGLALSTGFTLTLAIRAPPAARSSFGPEDVQKQRPPLAQLLLGLEEIFAGSLLFQL